MIGLEGRTFNPPCLCSTNRYLRALTSEYSTETVALQAALGSGYEFVFATGPYGPGT